MSIVSWYISNKLLQNLSFEIFNQVTGGYFKNAVTGFIIAVRDSIVAVANFTNAVILFIIEVVYCISPVLKSLLTEV